MTIRKAAVSGTFYTNVKNELSTFIQDALDNSSPQNRSSPVKGVISPHAGYIYSGQIAGYGFKTVQEREIDTVIIMSPSHHMSFPGVSIYDGDAYETPLGLVSLNKTLATAFRNNSPHINFYSEAHSNEHGIEVQLPFLQELYKDKPFTIVPIVFGEQSQEMIDTVKETILAHCDSEKTLIIASSDMSHFYNYDVAKKMDLKALTYIKRWQFDELKRAAQKREIEFCGYGPVVVLARVMEAWGCETAEPLVYANSGDVTEDRDRVVGYSSVVYS